LLITSAENSYWQTGTLTTVTSGIATVTVNDASTSQTWLGFGGAFNETGWNVLQMLSRSDQSKAINLLFGSDAANFTFGRIPIGASDYATSRYTDDEVTSGTDLNMTSFSITRDMQYLIPYVKAAQAVKSDVIFWASPWTPPTWMKSTSGTANGTSCALVGNTAFDGGCMVDRADNLTAYAQYFVKWVQAYAQQNITITAVSPQNEPNYNEGYPSCLWASTLYTKFVGQYLGPALMSASPGTQIVGGTMSNGNSTADPAVVAALMGDVAAKSYVKMLGFQWNMLPTVKSALSYNLPIWQTEHKAGNYPFVISGESPPPVPNMGVSSNPAPNDYPYAEETWGLIRDWIHAGVSSYSAWNMVLDAGGLGLDTTRNWWQDALLTVNTSARTLNVTPAYYVFRHLSQFVQPQAKVVATSGGDALAFKNPDGTIVTVMYNSGSSAQAILAVGGTMLQLTIPARGFATVVK
jgi:glucosylceramidase